MKQRTLTLVSVLFVLYLKYYTLYLLFVYVYVEQIQIIATFLAVGVLADAIICGACIAGAKEAEGWKC